MAALRLDFASKFVYNISGEKPQLPPVSGLMLSSLIIKC